MGSEIFELLLFGAMAGGIVLLVFFLDHRKRLTELEARMREMERELQERRQVREEVPAPASPPAAPPAPSAEPKASPMARAREAARQKAEESKPAAVPPPLPPRMPSPEIPEAAPVAAKEEKPESPEPVRAPVPVEPVPSPFGDWLEKIGMKPPQADEEGANLIAWWSTRAGLGLGVIAAVFFGLYVNQNTTPWVRLVELVALALALFGGGCWLERKLANFGRALTAGGLGLLYVAAYASYGLPAMKVTDSAPTAAVLQLLAVGLMVGWSLWKRNEGVFGLSLVLGYVTSWFSHQQGVEPLPLISLIVLAAAGTALLSMRGWWSGLWASLVGSSGGMFLLAVFSWRGGEGPSGPVGLAVACLLTVLFVGGLYLRRGASPGLVTIALPLVTSVGLVVGGVVTWALGLEWEWFYGSYALLLLGAGWLWRTGEEMLWEIMWAKASVFVALYLIAVLDGPVRAYGLLAQAGSLAFLAQRRGWKLFDGGALLAMLVGWNYASAELASMPVDTWSSPEFLVLGFLAGALGLVVWFGRGDRSREMLVFPVLVFLALAAFWTAVWRVNHDWTVVAALLGAVTFVVAGRWAGLWRSELLAVVFLVPMLFVLTERGLSLGAGGLEVSGVAWPVVLWLVATWGYCEWLARGGELPGRIAGDGMMLLSVLGVFLAGVEFFDDEWVVVVLLAVAVAWKLLHGRSAMPDLPFLSAAPALLGTVIFFTYWNGESPVLLVMGSLLAALAYWGQDLLAPSQEGSFSVRAWRDALRAVVLGLVLFTALSIWTSGSGEIISFGVCSTLMVGAWHALRDRGAGWIGLVAAIVALGLLSDHRTRDALHVISVALLFLLFVGNGLVLARSGRKDVVALPKVASVFWGIAAMQAVLLGLVVVGEVAGWTTAGCTLAAVLLLTAGFWGGLRGYRVIGLLGIGFAILRLFVVDLDDVFWRIVAFGVTGALLVGIGYIYNRFHRQLAEHDLDWESARASNGN